MPYKNDIISDKVNLIHGDCIKEMQKMKSNSIDAIVTDSPYGLEFMGKEWDKFKNSESWDKKGGTYKDIGDGLNNRISKMPRFNFEPSALQKFCFDWAKECLRVLKPGGYLLSFGGCRTYHRMTCAIEDAGFEIRDCIMWVYGSGFPKSLNIGKAIDKLQGNEREVVGTKITGGIKRPAKALKSSDEYDDTRTHNYTTGQTTIPDTKGTSEWEGWGTALKPAVEPIVVARKPLSEKSVAENILKWGTGGINIDGSRVGTEDDFGRGGVREKVRGYVGIKSEETIPALPASPLGRFPANLIHDNSPEVRECFPETKSVKANRGRGYGDGIFTNDCNYEGTERGFDDSGNASRFFKSIIYTPKASKSERNQGCEDLELKQRDESRKEGNPGGDNPRNRGVNKVLNNHPTVKPIKLMEYLIRLVTPPNGIVLDPFMGSGSTGIAAKNLGIKFIGIEKEQEYCDIAEKRILKYKNQLNLFYD